MSSLSPRDAPRTAGQPLIRITWEPAGISWVTVLATAIVAAGLLFGLFWILKPRDRSAAAPKGPSRPATTLVAPRDSSSPTPAGLSGR
jgi:hypothetical protein